MFVQSVCLSMCLALAQAQGDLCEEYMTCKQCVRSNSCQWCSSKDYENVKRCMSVDRMKECPEAQIQNPKGSVNYYINQDFSSETQIKPQRLKIKLRPSETLNFDFQFKAAKDYPADLYFLFDCSNTMGDTIQSAVDASENIYKKMVPQTANLLLGMGTFNDKNIAPFIRNKTQKVSSFSHKLKMTEDYNLLKEGIRKVSENLMKNVDGQEGGFDALAQAMSCKNEIGWRNDSRKFIFFFTNGYSHSAGDAKVAGIVRPYDGECYTENGIYTKELEFDYPSTSMLYELAMKEGVTIVFIVTSDIKKFYEALKESIRGSIMIVLNDKQMTSKDEDSIIKAYKSTTQTIKLDVVMASEDYGKIDIIFKPDCKTKGCDIPVNPKEPYSIRGSITLLRYYDKDQINVDVTIQNIKERLSLDIEVVDCDCEVEKNSTYCLYHGTSQCGICNCDAGRTGKKCKCEIEDTNCKQPGVKDANVCNGMGQCKCGKCKCDKGYSGRYCECESNRCVKNCNGHGTCYCGKCTCDNGWTGEYCNCEIKPCKTVNGKECNHRGLCECGECKCGPPAAWDARDSQNYETCEMKCTDCHDSQCLKLKECAICRQNNEENCTSTCGDIQVKVVEALSNITEENASICKNVPAGAGCYTRYRYQYDDTNYLIHLFIETEMDCLPSYYKWGGGVLISLLVIGVLTLVGWKLLTDYRDRREYQRFLKMHGADSGAGCHNPIYENPTTTIRNPAFRKPSVDYTLQ